jgi:hypothetical protein
MLMVEIRVERPRHMVEIRAERPRHMVEQLHQVETMDHQVEAMDHQVASHLRAERDQPMVRLKTRIAKTAVPQKAMEAQAVEKVHLTEVLLEAMEAQVAASRPKATVAQAVEVVLLLEMKETAKTVDLPEATEAQAASHPRAMVASHPRVTEAQAAEVVLLLEMRKTAKTVDLPEAMEVQVASHPKATVAQAVEKAHLTEVPLEAMEAQAAASHPKVMEVLLLALAHMVLAMMSLNIVKRKRKTISLHLRRNISLHLRRNISLRLRRNISQLLQ